MTSSKRNQSGAKSKKAKDEDGRKNTSLRLSRKTLKELKIKAIQQDTSVQQIIEKLVQDYLGQQDRPDE